MSDQHMVADVIVLAQHHGPVTRESLRVALECADLHPSREPPTHIAIPAQDEPLTWLVTLLGEIPTGTLGAGLNLLCCASPRLKGHAGKAFALLSVSPGVRLHRVMSAAEHAILAVL